MWEGGSNSQRVPTQNRVSQKIQTGIPLNFIWVYLLKIVKINLHFKGAGGPHIICQSQKLILWCFLKGGLRSINCCLQGQRLHVIPLCVQFSIAIPLQTLSSPTFLSNHPETFRMCPFYCSRHENQDIFHVEL